MKLGVARTWECSLWMTLCPLSKQPQIVFLLPQPQPHENGRIADFLLKPPIITR